MTQLDAARGEVDVRLEKLLAERERAEGELAAVAGGSEGAAGALYRLRSARERVEMRREAAADLLERLRTPVVQKSSEALLEQARLAEGRAVAVERALDEREGLPPAARALAEQGETLALSAVDVEPGREASVAAALGHRGAAVLADSAARGLELLEHARSAGLGSLVVLVGQDPAELVRSMPVVPLADLLASPVPAVTEEGFGYDPQRRRAVVRRRDRGGVPARAGGSGAAGCARRRARSPSRRPRRRPPRARPTRASCPCASASATSWRARCARRRAWSGRSPRAPRRAAQSLRRSPPG